MHVAVTGLLLMTLLGADSAPTSLPASVPFFIGDVAEIGRAIGEESTGPLVTGVRAVPVMLAALPGSDWKASDDKPGILQTPCRYRGVNYRFLRSAPQTAPATRPHLREGVLLRISVHPDRESARQALGRSVLSIPVGPQSVSNHFGDILYVWRSRDNISSLFAFRRDNVVVYLNLSIPFDEAMALGSKLDSLLLAGGPYVDKGTCVPAPTLSLSSSSLRLRQGQTQRVPMTIRDGDPADLLIHAEGNGAGIKRNPDGTAELIYTFPAETSPEKTRYVDVTVATPTNVVVTESIKVELLP